MNTRKLPYMIFRKYLSLIAFLFFIFGCANPNNPGDTLGLSKKLKGKWIAKAWTGELHEEWKIGEDGWLIQEGHYVENGDTSYSARTKIELIDQSIILFSVIKNSTPKIFEAKEFSTDGFTVENTEYRNPFQVEYRFIDSENYERIITGYEQDSLVSTLFQFKKAHQK